MLCQFISGEGVYTYKDVEYPYVSTPLSEIEGGYANLAEQFAAQKNENVIYLVELVEFNEEQLLLADYDEDREIDNSDLINLARYIVAQIKALY